MSRQRTTSCMTTPLHDELAVVSAPEGRLGPCERMVAHVEEE